MSQCIDTDDSYNGSGSGTTGAVPTTAELALDDMDIAQQVGEGIAQRLEEELLAQRLEERRQQVIVVVDSSSNGGGG